MIVCICQGVSDRVVRLVVASGATTLDAVAAHCGAGTDCGSCRHAILDIVEDVTAAPMSSCDSCVSGPTAELSVPVAAGA